MYWKPVAAFELLNFEDASIVDPINKPMVSFSSSLAYGFLLGDRLALWLKAPVLSLNDFRFRAYCFYTMVLLLSSIPLISPLVFIMRCFF